MINHSSQYPDVYKRQVILILGIGLVAMSMKVESYIGMFSMIVIFSLILIWGLYKKIINMSDEVYGKS